MRTFSSFFEEVFDVIGRPFLHVSRIEHANISLSFDMGLLRSQKTCMNTRYTIIEENRNLKRYNQKKYIVTNLLCIR
jgi:hypothetical protein